MHGQRTDAAFDEAIHTLPASSGTVRIESDQLGSKEIPSDAYWGINVARALDNFAISGRPLSVYPDLLFGFACVKQAAARANAEIGSLSPATANLIDRACEDIKGGRLRDQFVVDIMQGGAGTSTNMNVNEVVANRALELAGRRRADYAHIDPNDHVNRSQSTNDAYPTALKIGLCLSIERLLTELHDLERAFDRKARELTDILKVGRTQLQDAVPMTLEQELAGFAVTLAEDHASFNAVLRQLFEINLGATAIGTGIAADPRFAEAARAHLAAITGRPLVTARNLIQATTDVGVFMDLSATLKRSAIKLSKICNDLRLLSSGPQAGFGEINLPPRQAGSSIMPGKINPVIPECVNQVAFVVAGNDVTLTMAAEAGQLQLNAFGPVIAHVLFESLQWLTAAMATLRENCVTGITANVQKLASQTSSFVGVITAFTPYVGYGAAADLAKEALKGDASIADLLVTSGFMEREDVELLMQPARLAGKDTSEPVLSRDYAGGRGRELRE